MNTKMYRWHSELLANYGPGQIVVSAISIDEAKNLARASMDDLLKERYFYMYNSEDENDIAELKEYFEKDLSEDPDIISNNCLFIEGSN